MLREFYAARPSCACCDTAPRVKDIVGSNYAQLSVASERQHRRRHERARQPQQGRGRRRRAMDESPVGPAGNGRPHRTGGRLDLKDERHGNESRSGCRTRSPPIAAHDPLAPVFAQYPLEVVRAEGVWLHTRDGRSVLDLYGGHAVAALGYGHPAWTRALSDQAAQMNFQSNAVPMEVRTRAAQQAARVLAPAVRQRVLDQQRRRGQRERASRWRSRCARAHPRRGGGTELPWPHRRPAPRPPGALRRSGSSCRARPST